MNSIVNTLTMTEVYRLQMAKVATVASTCDPHTWKVETGGKRVWVSTLTTHWVPGYLGLRSETWSQTNIKNEWINAWGYDMFYYILTTIEINKKILIDVLVTLNNMEMGVILEFSYSLPLDWSTWTWDRVWTCCLPQTHVLNNWSLAGGILLRGDGNFRR